uniref:Uncharacterized protein n=1 Tax=Ulva sp. TM637 TaxID=2496872 RepID=A0A7R6NFC9_9CHLO|nr:hypothetical protein JXX86_mgp24 [Ulva sp. TM637]AZP40106.1 hypothetical protein [Ulva sp. TM637]
MDKPLKGLLIDEDGKYVGNNLDTRPRVKAGDWLNTLRWDIEMHLIGLISKKLDTKQRALISEYSTELAKSITEELINKELLASYKTVEKSIEKADKIKTPRYFIWNATNFLIFPKVFSLPMVVPPNDWIINDNNGADNGGYLLSELTNISYQGFLDSKSSRTHEHRLKIQKLDHINKLQKVKFSINNPIVSFYKRYTKELTDTGQVLLDDRWLQPTSEMCLEITRTHSNILTNPDQIREAVDKELESKRNETLRNQEALAIATLYCNKAVYWPAVQDFRGLSSWKFKYSK